MKGKKQYLLSVDIFKIICAVLVIAIHTAPLVQISPFTNYLVVQVLGRIAVPSFFALSSYYFYQKYSQVADKKKYLLGYCKRMALLYLLASVIYIPIWIYAHPSFTIIDLLKDIFLDGFHYHLWYFPALILGTVIVCFLEKYQSRRVGKIIIGLYVIGSIMNVYWPILGQWTGIATLPIEYLRNGLFFAPAFIYCGFHLKKIVPKGKHLLIAGIFYLLECLILHGTNTYTSVTSMYLSLLIIIPVLLQTVVNNGKTVHSTQQLHSLSSYLYIFHPLVIIGVEKIYSLNKMDVPNIALFLLTVVVTVVISLVINSIVLFFRQIQKSKRQIVVEE